MKARRAFKKSILCLFSLCSFSEHAGVYVYLCATPEPVIRADGCAECVQMPNVSAQYKALKLRAHQIQANRNKYCI